MTTPEQARQLVHELRYQRSDSHQVALAADCIESLLKQLEKADVTAYREAMNADVGIDYKSPGNAR